jgi:hypothetical protein
MAFDFHPFLCPGEVRTEIDQRLRGLSPTEIYDICVNRNESLYTRFFASLRLSRQDGVRLMDQLIPDRTDLLWTQLLFLPTDSPENRKTLWNHATEPFDEYYVAAVHLLAKFGDESSLVTSLQLLASEIDHDRMLAVACLKRLDTEQAWQVLRKYWPLETHPLKTRVRAAEVLLQRGESDSLDFLLSIARHDSAEIAYDATVSIYHHHSKEVGLSLMEQILKVDGHGGQDCCLRHVANIMGDYTIAVKPDGLAQVREWLASRTEPES